MSKPTLGRGLNDLLGTRRGAEQNAVAPSRVDGGLRILIDGAARAEEPLTPAAVPDAPPPAVLKIVTPRTTDAVALRLLAAAALAGADLALLGWAGWFTFTHEHALGFLAGFFCTLSVLTAALCGSVAVLLMPGGE